MSFLNTTINESSDYSIDKIETFINNKVTFNVYKRNWSQLESIYKKHKLKEYMETIFQEYDNISEKNKMEIIIAAAGMSAHLAGVTASLTTIPVLGVPTESKLKGLDSLLSTVQMPSGIPVGTLAIGKAGAINAALLAVTILSTKYKDIHKKLILYRKTFEKKVPKKPY